MKLKEFKTTSNMLQHFVEKYCRTLEKDGYTLDIIQCNDADLDALNHSYGVDEHCMIYDVESEQLLMSVWHGRGGVFNRPDHIEAGFSINGSLAEDNKIDNPAYFPTSYVTKDEVTKWIKRVIRRQTKNKNKEE